MNANNISCQIGLSEYNGKTTNKHVLTHRPSKVDLCMNKESQPTPESDETPIAKEAEHISSLSGDVDNFDHILKVTTHQEAVYAYYYMDENNKVCDQFGKHEQM